MSARPLADVGVALSRPQADAGPSPLPRPQADAGAVEAELEHAFYRHRNAILAINDGLIELRIAKEQLRKARLRARRAGIACA